MGAGRSGGPPDTPYHKGGPPPSGRRGCSTSLVLPAAADAHHRHLPHHHHHHLHVCGSPFCGGVARWGRRGAPSRARATFLLSLPQDPRQASLLFLRWLELSSSPRAEPSWEEEVELLEEGGWGSWSSSLLLLLLGRLRSQAQEAARLLTREEAGRLRSAGQQLQGSAASMAGWSASIHPPSSSFPRSHS